MTRQSNGLNPFNPQIKTDTFVNSVDPDGTDRAVLSGTTLFTGLYLRVLADFPFCDNGHVQIQ